MLMAANNGAGMNMGFPDVCLTPAGPSVVPVPYPNIAMNMMAAAFSLIVFITKRPGLNMGSTIPLTTGDEGGVAHPTIKGPGSYTVGNPKVFVDKLPAINLTCPTKGNGVNNGLGMVAVPSIVNVFYSLVPKASSESDPAQKARDPYARELDLAAAESLSETMKGGLGCSDVAEDGIGVLRIHMFSRALPSEVWSALKGLEQRGLRGLIVDLAGCPGGDVEACLNLAGDFLPEGTHLAILREADGDETLHKSVTETPFSFPLAIVVDEHTASAAEVLAGCLAFHGRAVLVGSKTFGKGAAQQVLTAEDGALHTASFAELLLPDGSRIEGVGLTPQVFADSHAQALSRAHKALWTVLEEGA